MLKALEIKTPLVLNPVVSVLTFLLLLALAYGCSDPQVVVVEKEVVREVPVEVIVEKEVVREVPVEVIVEKEVVREVPVEVVVEKEVVREVMVEVVVTATAASRQTTPPESPADLMICGNVNQTFIGLLRLQGLSIADCVDITDAGVKIIIFSYVPCGDPRVEEELLNFVREGGSVVMPTRRVSPQTGSFTCDVPLSFGAATNIGGHKFVGGYDTSRYHLVYFHDTAGPLGALSPSPSVFGDTRIKNNTRNHRTFTVRNRANCAFWLQAGTWYPSLAKKFTHNSRKNACVVVSGVLGEGKFLLVGGREALGTLTGGRNKDNWVDDEFTLSAIEWLLAPVVNLDSVTDDSSSSTVQEAVWTIASRIDSTEEQSRESLESLKSSLGEDVLVEVLKRVPVLGNDGWQSFGSWSKDFEEQTGQDPGNRFAEDPVRSGIHLLFQPEDLSYFIDIE